MSIWFGCLYASFFSHLNAHICMGLGESDMEETGYYMGKNARRNGKSTAPVLLWDMASDSIHFHASQQIVIS